MLRTMPEAQRKEWMTAIETACVHRNNMCDNVSGYSEKSWTDLVAAFCHKWGADNIPSNLKRDLILVGSKLMEDDYKQNHMFDSFNRDMRIHNNHNDRDLLREEDY